MKEIKAMARAEFNVPEASTINEVNTKRDPGLCFRDGGSHFKKTYTKTQINPITDPRAYHVQVKIIKELIT